MDSACGINFCLWRLGSAGGAWRVASLNPISCIHCGSLKDAHTSLASFLLLSLPGTVDSLGHHSRVLHILALHGTHWLNSETRGSRDISSSSSSKVFGNPLKKEATIGFSSSSSSKSEPLPLDPCSLDSVWGQQYGWEQVWSSNQTLQHLLFWSSLLCHWQSLLLDLALDCEWAQVQLSLSISSSRVDMVASTLWWASCIMARLLSTESSFLVLWGAWLLEEWGPSAWGHAVAAGSSSSSHLWWFGREDSTSSSIAGSPGGDPGSLCSLYT